MPEPILTDDEIVKLYLDGVAMNHIRANPDRIRRVLRERKIDGQKRLVRQYRKGANTAPPNEWIAQLKATADRARDLPRPVPRYTGESRLRDKLNRRRRREASGTLKLA